MIFPDRSRPGRGRRGVAATEASLIISIFFVLVLGMVEMARMAMLSHMVTAAATSSCRVATIANRSQADVRSTAAAILSGAGVRSSSSYTLATSPSDVTTTHFGDPISVTIQIPYGGVSWLSVPLFLGSATIRSTVTLSSERP